jgi:TonB family protein
MIDHSRRITTMHTSAAAHKHDWRSQERRSCPRESLNWIVLVFFGQNNWGKLIDLSEKGMCFQFEQSPSLKEPIEFTFEAMGCISIPHEANVLGDSFQAAGRVVWTQEFERTAGVQFLNLSARTRDQIRYWLSSAGEKVSAPPQEVLIAGHTAGLTEELKKEWDAEWNRQTGQPAPQPFTPKAVPPTLPQAPVDPIEEFPESELEESGSHLESRWQPETRFSPQPLPKHSAFHREPEEEFGEPSVEQETFHTNSLQEFEEEFPEESSEPRAAVGQAFWTAEPELPQKLETAASDAEMVRAVRARDRLEQNSFEPPAIVQQEGRSTRGATVRGKPHKARSAYIAAVTCLGALFVAAAVIAIATRTARRAGASEAAPLALGSQTDAKPEELNTVPGTGPLLVEVLDISSRRSVLWFTGDNRLDVSTREDSTVSRDSAVDGTPPASAKHESSRDFTLSSPHVASATTASTNGSEALTAPTIGEAPLTADVLLRANLPNPAAPVERTLPVGGDVQPARLIRAVLPAYPQLAKSNRVAGDVTLDALIDASGNVRDVTVISGPVFLREPAKIALKQWKYEPARLDGQPTAMHLTVTVKFKSDQK